MKLALPWRSPEEQPAELPATALIAERDPDDGTWYLLGIYMMTDRRPGVWVDEMDGATLTGSNWRWLPESFLLREAP